MAGAQGTAVGSAIAVASKRMKELEAPSKIVILITDGQSNSGGSHRFKLHKLLLRWTLKCTQSVWVVVVVAFSA